jgi:hypothetical protein
MPSLVDKAVTTPKNKTAEWEDERKNKALAKQG